LKRRTFSKSVVHILPFPFMGRRSSSLFFMIAAVFGLVFSAMNPQAVSNVRMAILEMAEPAVEFVSTPIQNSAVFVRNVTGLAGLQEENERLKAENEQLRHWYQTALNLQMENKNLQALLNVKTAPQDKYVTVRVMSDAGNRFFKSLLVAAGQDSQIQKSQAVISEDGVVGRVIEAGQNLARVLLVTDINSRLPVLIEEERMHAIMAGQNTDNPLIVHIPADASVPEGARVVTSGKGGVFPPGLPVGRVVKKGGQYSVELFADFSRLMYVRVIEKAPNQDFVQIQ